MWMILIVHGLEEMGSHHHSDNLSEEILVNRVKC